MPSIQPLSSIVPRILGNVLRKIPVEKRPAYIMQIEPRNLALFGCETHAEVMALFGCADQSKDVRSIAGSVSVFEENVRVPDSSRDRTPAPHSVGNPLQHDLFRRSA
jgi:hypothetical protein